MERIKLVTDSSCDLPSDIINKYNINLISLNVSFGQDSFIDRLEIDNNTFYERMGNEKELPKTSCPSPDRFVESYEGDEENILVLTLASKLSGTYSAAVLAKDIYLNDNNNKNIEVIDTCSGSIGAGLLLISAAKMIEEGRTMKEIVSEVERLKKELVFYGTLDTLENAIKGGRVNPIAGKIINSLNFKVIIHINDGVVKPVDKARGEMNSIKKVLDKIENQVSDTENRILGIAHANCLEKAKKVKELIESKHKFKEIIISEVGPVMGTYSSKGAILVSVL